MQLTYLDSNSWLIEIAQKRILLDPWLVDNLVFGNQTWLFKGEKLTQREIPSNIDLILLSQGLEDHTHPPTLKQLDHNLPVVGSPNAAKVTKNLGYSQVTALKHGETFNLANQVEIKAFPGSPIGPTLIENAYLIKDLATKQTIYYEPHGEHSPKIKEVAPVDVLITPIANLSLPLIGSIIKGQKTALEICQWLQPQVILPTAAGGDVKFEGLLLTLLRTEGTAAEFREMLAENNLNTRVIDPKPGESFALELVN
ncbi:MAG: MBL fold metallo-hydrolase [Oscillatoria sp. PMC 1068.18]|nr:MBL fold metallo-hydrolase [Oscillatoria sp. PMC 1076.18]MEC4988093.1 MBL fold metallo-hydrolase [Oscillatoria sp. PMC 1068.18]